MPNVDEMSYIPSRRGASCPGPGQPHRLRVVHRWCAWVRTSTVRPALRRGGQWAERTVHKDDMAEPWGIAEYALVDPEAAYARWRRLHGTLPPEVNEFPGRKRFTDQQLVPHLRKQPVCMFGAVLVNLRSSVLVPRAVSSNPLFASRIIKNGSAVSRTMPNM